jgi:hypothetical protein
MNVGAATIAGIVAATRAVAGPIPVRENAPALSYTGGHPDYPTFQEMLP